MQSDVRASGVLVFIAGTRTEDGFVALTSIRSAVAVDTKQFGGVVKAPNVLLEGAKALQVEKYQQRKNTRKDLRSVVIRNWVVFAL